MEFREIRTKVPEAPDRLGTRFSTRIWAVILLASVIVCWFVQSAFPLVIAAVPHGAWLAFHLVYAGTLIAVYAKQKEHTNALSSEVA